MTGLSRNAGAFQSSAASATVGFLSSSVVYENGDVDDSITGNSFTPHASAEEVVLVIQIRVAFNDTIDDLTVTIDSTAPDAQVAFPSGIQGVSKAVWIGRWRGAPSGTVTIQSDPGGAGATWTAIVCTGLSLDTAATFGDTTRRVDDAATATTTGEQSITSEQDNSLGIFGVAVNGGAGTIVADATHTFDERQEGQTGTSGPDVEYITGTKDLGSTGSKSVQADWDNAEAWSSLFAELKAA